MSVFRHADFLLIGGGVVGLNIATEIARRYPDAKVLILEKECRVGDHASGRNSGVLHAGFYYTADSLKAQFTRDGNLAMTEFCESHGLRINKCGKLVVARNESDLVGLETLLQRGQVNGVRLEKVSLAEAKTIEPRVKTFKFALYSPSTASVDPKEVVAEMLKVAETQGVEIHYGVKYLGFNRNRVLTNHGDYQAGYVINTAGLYADHVARDFGFSDNYYLLPFKGLYLYSREPRGSLSTNVYPVPDLGNPFLGVHYTVSVDGHIKIGPTAMPAFWREQYTWTDNFSLGEFTETIMRQSGLIFSAGFDFRRIAMEEMIKYCKSQMVARATNLIDGVNTEDYKVWGTPGIRAQLINRRKRTLEMDFIIEGDDRSMHILNAVSPAFTCSIPFSRFVVDRIDCCLNT